MIRIRPISELKTSAKNCIRGYKTTLALSSLIYLLFCIIYNVCNFLYTTSSIFTISAAIVTKILLIGLSYQAFNLSIWNEVSIKNIFVDFYKLGKILLVELLLILVSFLFLILSLILILFSIAFKSMTIASVLYIIFIIIDYIFLMYITPYVSFVVFDNKDMNCISIFKYTLSLAMNNLFKIILFEISYIPLNLLGCLGLGIPFIWITPYYLVAKSQLYLDMKEEYILTHDYN